MAFFDMFSNFGQGLNFTGMFDQFFNKAKPFLGGLLGKGTQDATTGLLGPVVPREVVGKPMPGREFFTERLQGPPDPGFLARMSAQAEQAAGQKGIVDRLDKLVQSAGVADKRAQEEERPPIQPIAPGIIQGKPVEVRDVQPRRKERPKRQGLRGFL